MAVSFQADFYTDEYTVREKCRCGLATGTSFSLNDLGKCDIMWGTDRQKVLRHSPVDRTRSSESPASQVADTNPS